MLINVSDQKMLLKHTWRTHWKTTNLNWKTQALNPPKLLFLLTAALDKRWCNTNPTPSFLLPICSTDNEFVRLLYTKVFLQLKFGAQFLKLSPIYHIHNWRRDGGGLSTWVQVGCNVSVRTWTHNVTLKESALASQPLKAHLRSTTILRWTEFVLISVTFHWEPGHREWVVISSDDMQGTSRHWHTGNWMSQQSQGLHVLDCALLTSPITLL